MANNSHRLNDPNTAGAGITQITQTSVFTNNLLQSVDTSLVLGHGTGSHSSPTTANGSSDVYAEDTPVNFKGNGDTCGHVRDTGSNDVFINVGSNTIQGLPILDVSEILNIPEVKPGLTELQAAIHLKDEEIEDDGLAVFPIGTVQQSINNGLIENIPDPVGIDEDTEPPNPVAEVPGDCTDINNEIINFNFPGTFQLSPNFTLSQLTTDTVISNYPLVTQGGLTTNDIVCNLRLLCINILEPIFQSNPNMIITSGFRHGSGSSQHNKGQAVDIQFTGFSFQNYWDESKNVKSLLPYDQFILELGNTYWFHLSYIPNGRHQVLTRIRPGKYVPGLIRIV